MTAVRPLRPDVKAHPPIAQWARVSVRYPYTDRDAVGPVSLVISPGDRVLLLGPSGSGKSTLLQTLTGIIPQSVPATVAGDMVIGGASAGSRAPSGWASDVAYIFQDCEQTLTGLRVEDEIAFALENRALPEAEIKRRVGAVMAHVGLPGSWRPRRTSTLSGGEKQMVALAATLIAGAPLFVADEPTASLAPRVAQRMYDLLLKTPGDGAILIVDHRLDQMIAAIDRVAVLDHTGALVAEDAPGPLFRAQGDLLDDQGIWTPLVSRFDRTLMRARLASAIPSLTMTDLLHHLASLSLRDQDCARMMIAKAGAPLLPKPSLIPGKAIARLDNAACAPLFGPVVLKDVTMDIRAGEVVGIIGSNGAGKSTLGACLAGLLRPKSGRREGAPGAIAFQNPENQFFEVSVLDEIVAALDLKQPSDAGETETVLDHWGLSHVATQHPYQLSQGQKRRLVLACLTATDRWPLLVLDEPTSGLDARGVATVAAHIEALAAAGRAVAVITHDMDVALSVCDRLVVLADGGIVADGRTREIFGDTALLDRTDLVPPAVMPMLDWLETDRC